MVTIAVTGKGGTGKTIISALLIHFLSKKYDLLAVDADPDSNLPDALGVTPRKTLGEIREVFQVSRDEMGTLNKEQWLEGKIYSEAITETDDYDLLVMGRPEGEGCYCFANSLLRGVLRKLMKHYDVVVIDTEAGLEHFSRGTISGADYILVVTDMSRKGLSTAKRIKELSSDLKLNFKKIYLVGNRIMNEDGAEVIKKFADEEGLELLELLPYSEEIVKFDIEGKPVVMLDDNSDYSLRVKKIAEKLVGDGNG
ncbi:CO dehydrogenase maturation factor [Archaeoglobus sulfaticallidus PM70-1]|uniref:CO dehydrogenase maturation factor n=1 Tax=Archaeoglobus sulfaticallidus PM70-1 TaxID=387631 RepID=N0BNT0_9EURY|nr:AAA family ATPase [Archaeoglobus sulfaticallidus]AGK61990.1 CO dehydrogenase maturation factor [Archaeoglobus sulfaticallidus PM70-1]